MNGSVHLAMQDPVHVALRGCKDVRAYCFVPRRPGYATTRTMAVTDAIELSA